MRAPKAAGPPVSSRRRWAHRLAALVLCCLATVALLEIALQIASVAAWYLYRPAAKPASGKRVVLCIGDSYTFGFGASASERSYPAVLEQMLRKSDDSWRVVNAGWPGRNSRDVLLALGREYSDLRPSLVYIMIGANDSWSRPERLVRGGSGGSGGEYQWRWRTARLASLLAAGARESAVRIRARVRRYWVSARLRRNPSPAGDWMFQGTRIRIRTDGLITAGDLTLRWRVRGDEFEVFPYDASSDLRMRLQWSIRDGRLFLKGGQFPEGIWLDPATGEPAPPARTAGGNGAGKGGAPPPPAGPEDHLGKGNLAMAKGDWRTAETEFLAALATTPPAFQAGIRALLAQTYAHEGNRAAAAGELGKIRKDWEATGRQEQKGQLLVNTAEMIGEGEQALEAARQLAKLYPLNAWFARTIAWQSFQRHDLATAAAEIDRAVDLAAGDPKARAFFLQLRANIVRTTDPAKSLESAVSAYLIDRDRRGLILQLGLGGTAYSPAILEACLQKVNAGADARREVWLAMREAQHPAAYGSASILEDHLRQMVESVRNSGSEPVLMSYPFQSEVNRIARRVARRTGAGWVDVEADFLKRLKTTRREDLFVADGHLNDRGYAIVAGMVAGDALRRNSE